MAKKKLSEILVALAQAFGVDIKTLSKRQGDLEQLQTENKTSLVNALNEVLAKTSGAGNATTQQSIEQAISAFRNELMGGDVDAQLDTLKELGDKLKELEGDESIKAAILNKFAEIRQELTAVQQQLDDLIPQDLVEVYLQARGEI